MLSDSVVNDPSHKLYPALIDTDGQRLNNTNTNLGRLINYIRVIQYGRDSPIVVMNNVSHTFVMHYTFCQLAYTARHDRYVNKLSKLFR